MLRRLGVSGIHGRDGLCFLFFFAEAEDDPGSNVKEIGGVCERMDGGRRWEVLARGPL